MAQARTKKRKRAPAQPITRSAPTSISKSADKTDKKSIHRGPALIRKFHTLQSALKSAVQVGDAEQQERIETEITHLGGIQKYQKASIRGQDPRRGGDSSKTLVDWLKSPDLNLRLPEGKSKVLEIGSLSTDNYISKYSKLSVTRIDLNSQNPAIQEQDFLERPVPSSSEEEFDGISCSLVLNFVPTSQRSDFLLHLTKFLPLSTSTQSRWLFFVMPAPCIQNSRYTDKKLLLRVFDVLGFQVVKEKITDRIAYWLFERVKEVEPDQRFKKVELQRGKDRNNFFIPLET